MKNQKISVIMSTYNEKKEEIDRAIISILNQSYSNLEFIIVCDNPSNMSLIQNLTDWENKDKRIHLIFNDQNIGLTASLNKALDVVSGVYVARMDADDESLPERLEEQKKFLEKKCLDLVGCYIECVNEKGELIYKLQNMPTVPKEVKRKIHISNPIAHPTWLGKKEVFINNKGYRNIPYAEDYDFLLRANSKDVQLGNLNKILFRYTMRSDSISNKNGLKQYLISRKLIELAKQNEIESFNKMDVEKVLTNINEIDERKYMKASVYFTRAMVELEKHKIICVIDFMKACFTSRYYLKKMVGYVKAFL